MNKNVLAYIMILLLIISILVSSIILSNRLSNTNQLQNYEMPENTNIYHYNDEYVVDKRDMDYGIAMTGYVSYLDENNRYINYIVEHTSLEVGDIIHVGDKLDINGHVLAANNGIVFEIDHKDEETEMTVYNYDNLVFNSEIDTNTFRNFNEPYDAMINLNGNPYMLDLYELKFDITNDVLNLKWSMKNITNLNEIITENMTFTIKVIMGTISDTICIPLELYDLEGESINILRDDDIIKTKIVFGKVGFDYIQLTNEDIFEGDILILDGA